MRSLLAIFTIIFFLSSSLQPVSFSHAAIPITGIAPGELSHYDSMMTGLMEKYRIPGASLAVAKDGRLVFWRGYGYADLDSKEPVMPRSLFRIASVSKPITAAAILALLEEGRLNLDERAFGILSSSPSFAGTDIADPRLRDITVRDLLRHTAGWDREREGDPMLESYRVAREMGVRPPLDCATVIRYIMGRPLDYAPGEWWSYSNVGYCVLGRIIEVKTGMPYEEYVMRHVLVPMGIPDMRIGSTQARLPREVIYYDFPRIPAYRSVEFRNLFPTERPYGSFSIEGMDANGGWVASSADLVRFLASLEGSRGDAFLEKDTLALLTEKPLPLWGNSPRWYGLGFFVRSAANGEEMWFHTGALPGTSSILVRAPGGVVYAALFNSQPRESGFFRELDRSLLQAAQEVVAWPEIDLFLSWPAGVGPC